MGSFNKKNRKRRRGISVGTIVMILLTAGVVFACVTILPRISGDQVNFDGAQQAISSISDSFDFLDLSLSDIPIFGTSTNPPNNNQSPSHSPETNTNAPETASPAATATPIPRQTISLSFGGALNFDNNINKSALNSETQSYYYNSIFSEINNLFKGEASIAFLDNTIISDEKISKTNAPASALEPLKSLGIDMLALSHPDINNSGFTGLRDTIGAVRSQGFAYTGARLLPEDQSYTLIELKGVKIAVFQYLENLGSTGNKKLKSDDAAYSLMLYNKDTINQELQGARDNGANIIIVLFHWKNAQSVKPSKNQTAIAQQIANGGADVFIGTNGNSVMPVNYLSGTRQDGLTKTMLTAYSLGALLIGDSRDTEDIGSIVLHLELSYDFQMDRVTFDKAAYTPTYMWRYKQDGAYQYRVVASNRPAPNDMDESQQKTMKKILEAVQKYLGDSPIEVTE